MQNSLFPRNKVIWPCRTFIQNITEINIIYPTIFTTNARSIRNKFAEFQITVNIVNPDIIIITETWIRSSDDLTYFNIFGYDARHNLRDGRTGGGISIWCRSSFKLFFGDDARFSGNPLNSHLINLFLDSIKTIFIGIYIPPYDVVHHNQEITDFITSYCETAVDYYSADKSSIVIVADFNNLNVSCCVHSFNLINIVNKAYSWQ